MFLVRYFRDSFKFKTMLDTKDKTLTKLIIFVIVMILLSTFPLNYEAVKSEGGKFNFIIESFKSNPNWSDLPPDYKIMGGKLINNGRDEKYTYTHKDITYVINGDQSDLNLTSAVIFYEYSIVYIDDKGSKIETFGYKGFTDIFNFRELDFAEADQRVEWYETFSRGVEKSFKDILILNKFKEILVIFFVSNFIYIILLSLLVQLYRFGFERYMTYKEGLKFVLLAYGPTSIMAFITGLISVSFAPVMFQLVSGLIVMLVPLLFAKKIFY